MTPTATPGNAGNAAETMLAGGALEYITLTIADQLFGLPIGEVHEVFSVQRITRVPLAARPIKGLVNLRGRVVTAICLRAVLNLPDGNECAERMAIGVEIGGEPFALLVDRIGDVVRLPPATREPNPIHLNADWQNLSKGVHRLETSLLVILNPDRIVGSETLAS